MDDQRTGRPAAILAYSSDEFCRDDPFRWRFRQPPRSRRLYDEHQDAHSLADRRLDVARRSPAPSLSDISLAAPGALALRRLAQPDRALRTARRCLSAATSRDVCAAPRADDVRAGPRHAGAVAVHRRPGRQGDDAGRRSARIRSRADARLHGGSAGRRPADTCQPERAISRLQAGFGRPRASRNSPPVSIREASPSRRTSRALSSDMRPTASSTPSRGCSI